MGLLNRFDRNITASPEEKKDKVRMNTSVFAIVVGILTIIGAFAVPLMYGYSISAFVTETVISCVLGVLFIVCAVLFLRFDHIAIAIVMLVLFVYYVIDKIIAIAIAVSAGYIANNFALFLWLAFGIAQIANIVNYFINKVKAKAAPKLVAEIQEVANAPALQHEFSGQIITCEPTDTAAAQPTIPVAERPIETIFCQSCGLKNSRDAERCTGCNASLQE